MLRRFYAPQLLESRQITLDAREAHHAHSVLRFKVADKVELFDGQGRHAEAVFTSLTSKNAQLERSEVQTAGRYPLEIHLAQAVPHKQKLDEIVEKSEELAVSRLILLKSERTVFDFKKISFEKLLTRLRLLVLEGAKQSRNDHLMEVTGWETSDSLLKTFSDYSRVFLLSPGASFVKDLFEGVTETKKPVLMLIGPEGGFSPEEEKRFLAGGAFPVSLGDILLRCDTAAVAGVSVLKREFEKRINA